MSDRTRNTIHLFLDPDDYHGVPNKWEFLQWGKFNMGEFKGFRGIEPTD